MKKKIIIGIGIVGIGTILTAIHTASENRKLRGVIQNQTDVISGLLYEIKKLSYHLGKKKV